MAGAAKTAAPRRAAVASSAQASLSVLETEELLLLQCIEDLAGLVPPPGQHTTDKDSALSAADTAPHEPKPTVGRAAHAFNFSFKAMS